MIPILYSAETTNFSNNGLGGLGDCISCKVTEERNGKYILTMVYPVDGIHFTDITYSAIIKAIPSDGASEQLFRVYKISKPLNGRVTIEADHISYQLSFIPVEPFTATSVTDALQGLIDNSMETNPFTMWTDKSTSANFKLEIPTSCRSILGGVSGSILDVYGGEYEFDNYTVKLHADRGANNGVTLRYGKNITDIRQDENIANTITGICPYYNGGSTPIYGSIQYSDNANNYPFKRTVVKDFTSYFENTPTVEELEARARTYITDNNIGIPKISIEVSFAALWQTEEYKNIANLERVKLCDTVKVIFEKLDITAQAKVIKTEYDVLKERYDKIEIGEARSTLVTAIQEVEEKAEEAVDPSVMKKAIDHATKLITGGLGGYVYLKPNANGQPEEILIMDSPSINTAVNIIRMNLGGIAFSQNGYSGPFTTAWTINSTFYADFITAGTMLANRIKGGTLSLGGSDNGNGVMRIYNSSGTQIGKWDKDGISASNGSFSGSISGSSISGTSISGGSISGTTISGSTIKSTDGTTELRIANGAIEFYYNGAKQASITFKPQGTQGQAGIFIEAQGINLKGNYCVWDASLNDGAGGFFNLTQTAGNATRSWISADTASTVIHSSHGVIVKPS